jgi:hypothetical protein
MTRIKSVLAATAIAMTAMIGGAAAMPASNLDNSSRGVSATQDVRWVCGPFRCWWRPNFYAFYGPRFYHRPFFFHRRFYFHRHFF